MLWIRLNAFTRLPLWKAAMPEMERLLKLRSGAQEASL